MGNDKISVNFDVYGSCGTFFPTFITLLLLHSRLMHFLGMFFFDIDGTISKFVTVLHCGCYITRSRNEHNAE